MLQNLYNQFDVFCGQIDVYKVGKLLQQQYDGYYFFHENTIEVISTVQEIDILEISGNCCYDSI